MVTTATRVKRKIETIMTGEVARKPAFLVQLLTLISIVYGGLVKLRETLYKKDLLQSKTLLCPVISIGNITLGGVGKTPMAIYMAKRIERLGYRVAVISRGYKGKAEKTGGVVCDGRMIYMAPEMAGDEPYMIAKTLKTIPVIVGQDRYKAGMLAIERFTPDVLLLDDGFQHLGIGRDIDLVLLDSKKPFGNTYLFPRGTLRETASALKRGDAVILTRSDIENPVPLDQIKRLIPGKPIFQSVHTPYIVKIVTSRNPKLDDRLNISSKVGFDVFKNTSVFAFSGIARNDDFRRTIKRFGCRVKGFSAFPDHHQYSDKELDTLSNSAMDRSVDFIMTTEKDYIRIVHKIEWPIDLVVVGIKISFKNNDHTFDTFLDHQLSDVIKQKKEIS
ncbi:MAG: tetraacyldisaccharide 4'-kinase [Desulfobacterales bacterium]|nr:MAG: tetraacyldisaccharide 4'-kinase [Desulfobacterales bacterium]